KLLNRFSSLSLPAAMEVFTLSLHDALPISGEVQEWYELGLQILGPAHYGPNKYCYGTGSEGGFSEEGRELLKEMSRVGMLMDATDRKSTRLNSSHVKISYAVFCLQKKTAAP